ncbi:Zinc finger, TTF-type [Parasponia andersonii]|uniref:Zinc finger, TTF-type n=1 Tax=Parasponia andersonii TaxID=3476 RepID=A0A2P5AH67_PARAD|nr:Zinc finger, TTF-type [Parasponia andersonii]
MMKTQVKNVQENVKESKINKEIKELNQNLHNIPLNIFDSGRWENIIDSKLRDLLVEKGPILENNINFPKDKNFRHFSTIHYIQKLSNGETHDRKWLAYSRDFNKVYCFCCKLFNTKHSTSQLSNEGSNDWKNLSSKLKSHKTTNEHITNMSAWIDLELRFSNNKTIDINIQEKINREKEHWKNF